MLVELVHRQDPPQPGGQFSVELGVAVGIVACGWDFTTESLTGIHPWCGRIV
jgi:hypothetical protein